jgi:hypothetical protein
VILADTAKLQLFHKLAEKESTKDNLFSNLFYREEIPNFYKNINACFSKAYKIITYNYLNEDVIRRKSFKIDVPNFFLEIEEADEAYICK